MSGASVVLGGMFGSVELAIWCGVSKEANIHKSKRKSLFHHKNDGGDEFQKTCEIRKEIL